MQSSVVRNPEDILSQFTSNRMTYVVWLFAVLVLILMGLAVRHLNDFMWTDEYRTMYYAGATYNFSSTPSSLSETLTRVADNRWQAPFYYLILWAWGFIAGHSVFVMRIPALYFGLFTLVLTYRLTKNLYSHQVAIYATLILGFNGFFLHFLSEMRTYSLMMLLTVVLLWLYTIVIRMETRHLALLVAFVITIALMLYTHYFSIFAIAGLGLYHLLFKYKAANYWTLLLCFVIGGLLFLPWLPVIFGGIELTEGRSYKNLSGYEAITDIFYIFSNGSTGFFLLLLIPVFYRRLQDKAFVLAWLLFSFGLLWGVTRLIPAFLEIRYAVFVWPALCILIGLGLQEFAQFHFARTMLALWIIVFFGTQFSSQYQQRIHTWQRPPFRVLAAAIKPLTQEHDSVLYVLPPLVESVNDSMLEFYFEDDHISQLSFIRDTYATSDDAIRRQVLERSEDAERVWLTYETDARSWRVGTIETMLANDMDYLFCGVATDDDNIFAEVFAAQPLLDANDLSFTTQENHEIGFYNLAEPAIRNDTLFVNVAWYIPDGVNAQNYAIGVHLDDAQHQFLRQFDIGVTSTGFGCRLAAIDISDLEQGAYLLKVTVYNRETNQRLPNVEQRNRDDARVTLGEVYLAD